MEESYLGGNTISHTSTLLNGVATQLGITDIQLDGLFVSASEIGI
jgi:hypothetical protein